MVYALIDKIPMDIKAVNQVQPTILRCYIAIENKLGKHKKEKIHNIQLIIKILIIAKRESIVPTQI